MAGKTTKTYNGYKPPFTLSAKAVELVADIAAQIQNTVHKHKGDPLNGTANGTANGTTNGTVNGTANAPVNAPVNASANKTQNTIIKVIKGCSINSF